MHLYRFINPSAYGADKCVIIVSATNVQAYNAYVNRYHPNANGVLLSKDFHRNDVVIMSVSLKQLKDGVVIFSPILALEIF